MPNADFPKSATQRAIDTKQSRMQGASSGAAELATAVADAIAETGVPIIATPIALQTDLKNHFGTLAAGTYTHANFLAITGWATIAEARITCKTGTLTVSQGGTISALQPGSSLALDYAPGRTIGDFSVTVEFASTALFVLKGE